MGRAARGYATADPRPQRDNTCALFVTYHPDRRLVERVALVRPQVGRVVIIDNASHAAARMRLRELRARTPGCALVENARNLGIATALNQGARWARALGYAWLLTLDQDSWPASDLLAGLAQAYAAYPQRQQVKLIGANYASPVRDQPATAFAPGNPALYRESRTVVTSGSLLSLSGYAATGPFRDDFFIDGVDLEYCLRLWTLGFRVLTTRRVLLTHALGRPEQRRWLGRVWTLTNHAPVRRYYIARNRLALLRRYPLHDPRYTLAELRRMVFHDPVQIWLEEDRWPKLRAMVLGLWHGLRGRLGPAPDRMTKPEPLMASP